MFRSLFKKESASTGSPPRGPVEFVVAGLGNPGEKYEYTRHNTGFLFLDLLAHENGFKIDRLKFKSLYCDTVFASHRVLFLKPTTFMNLSGEAVRDALVFYKLPPERLVVVYDDVSLPLGKLRVRGKGSDGGHNGVKSIIYHTKTDEFPRIKIGVGANPNPERDLADWVLSRYGKEDLVTLKEVFARAEPALKLLLDGELEKAMNQYNG